jgi:NAD(P)-dependent dehydrogenase (short-subunit alcohol dehydrogenase family)
MTTVVMTGGTSGLGASAAKEIMRSPDTRLLLGARGTGPKEAEMLPLDLARLDEVRSFASTVQARLESGGIDALVLNAGGGHRDSRTVDGFETNFAVNHLAHYLLLRLLLPVLADGAVVILTTSGTHDPAEGTIIPPPRHADAFLLAHPEQDPDREADARIAAGRAYSSSKLCNLLTARALAARPEAKTRRLTVVAYDPGPTPGTGLVRDRGVAANFVWRRLGPVLRFLVPRFNSREVAGRTLADLALNRIRLPEARIYAALRRDRLAFPDPSVLARRDDVRDALWRDSAKLVGMPETEQLSASHDTMAGATGFEPARENAARHDQHE